MDGFVLDSIVCTDDVMDSMGNLNQVVVSVRQEIQVTAKDYMKWKNEVCVCEAMPVRFR